jgi:hypothetical protein
MKSLLGCGIAATLSLSAAVLSRAADSPVLATPASVQPSHVAFVVDTSGSMRDAMTDRLHDVVGRLIRDYVDAHPSAREYTVVDADGRVLTPPNDGPGTFWAAIDRANTDRIANVVLSDDRTSYSSPVPGMVRVFREAPEESGVALAICVIGDEYNGIVDPVFRRVAELNPPDAAGRRRATIDA